MKVVVFGVGKLYQERKKLIPSDIEIVAFLDNNLKLHGGYMDGKPIISPYEVSHLSYDKIILMSINEDEMVNQLLKFGVKKKDIWYWEYFSSKMNHGILKVYCRNKNIKKNGKKILIISTDLNYDGGSMAALYAARALQARENLVVLAAPDGDKVFIEEAMKEGVNIVLCPALPYVYEEEIIWIQQFEVVLVNVFQMAPCVCVISKIRPVLWWIHEPRDLYDKIILRFQIYFDKESIKFADIYAVSSIAQKNFNFHFPDKIQKILPYGIPDKNGENVSKVKKNNLVFALIGVVCPIKAQDIYIKAIEMLNIDEKRNVQFWIIGPIGTDEYSNRIKKIALKEEVIKITGMLTRDEIHKAYQEIDVVVCPSREDSLPIVVTEGMMYGKTCIVSDRVGSVQYISDGENGLVCKAESPMDLCEKIRWVIYNQDKISIIGNNARLIYKRYFSMEKFGERLENNLQDAINNWRYIKYINK